MKKILILIFLLISSLGYGQYDLTFNSGYGIKWNSGSYYKSTAGTLYLKGSEMNFRNLLDAIKFNVDDSGNVDITGEYRINGVAITTGGGGDYLLNSDSTRFALRYNNWNTDNLDSSRFLYRYDSTRFALRWNNWDKSNLDTSTLVKRITSTDNAITRYDGTSGRVQNSGVTIDDNNNIVLPSIVGGETKGIIYKGSETFLHTYKSSFSGSVGQNIFIGKDAGNFTLLGAAVYEASTNVAIGGGNLNSLTSGYGNTAIGYNSLSLNTSGLNNLGLGSNTLTRMVSGTQNTGIGAEAMRYGTGSSNVMIGTQSGKGVDGSSTYTNGIGIGFQTLTRLTTGTTNIAIGYRAGDSVSTGASNIIIGKDVDPSSNTASNELNIGGAIYGTSLYGTSLIGIETNAPNSTLQINGSISYKYDTTSVAKTLDATHYLMDCTAGTFAVTLPTAVGCQGRVYYIFNSGAGIITINTTSSQTINASASGAITLPTKYDKIQVMSNGANWLILNQ